jgi:hypothetical protein
MAKSNNVQKCFADGVAWGANPANDRKLIKTTGDKRKREQHQKDLRNNNSYGRRASK